METYALRDLRQGRLTAPTAPCHHKFATTFLHRDGVPLSVQRNYFEGGDDVGEHWGEDFYSLYIVRGGRGTEIVNGHPYVISRGDVYIVPVGTPHGFRDYEALEMDGFYFQIPLFTRGEIAALRLMTGFWKLFVPYRAPGGGKFRDQRLRLDPEQHRAIEALIEEIRGEMVRPEPIGPYVARGLFLRLLGTLARWHGSRSGEAGYSCPDSDLKGAGAHTAALDAAVRYCEENFGRDITVPELAARAFLSPDHFSRLFAAHAGQAPAAYIRSLRLGHAQALLRGTDLDVADVARRCGFGGAAQLARAFQGSFGCAPTAYRKSFGR